MVVLVYLQQSQQRFLMTDPSSSPAAADRQLTRAELEEKYRTEIAKREHVATQIAGASPMTGHVDQAEAEARALAEAKAAQADAKAARMAKHKRLLAQKDAEIARLEAKLDAKVDAQLRTIDRREAKAMKAGVCEDSNAVPMRRWTRGPARALWRDGERFDLRVYLTTSRCFKQFDRPDLLVWEQRGLTFDFDARNAPSATLRYAPQRAVRERNRTLYAHAYFTKQGYSPDPKAGKRYARHATVHARHPVTKHVKLPENQATRSLLGGGGQKAAQAGGGGGADGGAVVPVAAAAAAVDEGGKVVNFWKPTLTLHMVHDFNIMSSAMPAQIAKHIRIDPATGSYHPVAFASDFWLTESSLVRLNATAKDGLDLEVSFAPLSLMKWQMQSQMEENWARQQAMGLQTTKNLDEVRRIMAETNPILLAVTGVVSLLHMVFDMMAFKNTISFWRNNKSMEGLSVQKIYVNVFFQLVIFLYLLDNDTSWMILLSNGIGMVLEVWKVKKAVKMRRRAGFPWIAFEDRVTYTASKTKQYDKMAMRYLRTVVFPLVVGFSAYSLLFLEHRSWYSWALGSLVGFVYAFGFIMMTPQLFINYKMQSVAHLPWRAMVYKALNTFVDDLFAFVIKMPTLHRLACFRDDLVFFIFLYQRWIYKVDKKRRNFMGETGEEAADRAAGKQKTHRSKFDRI